MVFIAVVPLSGRTVSQLKDAASNVKNSSSNKFNSVRSKFSSTSSSSPQTSEVHSSTNTNKGPPPPPPPRRYDQQRQEEQEESTLPQAASRPAPQNVRSPPPIRHNTRRDGSSSHISPPQPPVRNLVTSKRPVSESINWSALSPDDKDVFFGWLDEFFGGSRPVINSVPPAPSRSIPAPAPKPIIAAQLTNDFTTSHPPATTLGSAAEDFHSFFSSSTHWDTAWYTSDSPVPPPLETITDCMRTYSMRWAGETHTITGAAFFSDLSACWFTVEWSKRSAQDTSRARRSAVFTPRPAALTQEELVLAHETYGETIAAFAEGYEGTGQWCARGECWDLASEALKTFEQWDYIPKPIPSISKTHGHLIYEGKAWGKNANTQQAGRWRGGDDRIRRGDIVQWKTVTIKDGRMSFTLGFPDHTAVIVRDQEPLIEAVDGGDMRPRDLGKLEVVEQSVHSPPSRQVYTLTGMEAGEVWIYRPVGMEAYLNFIFGPTCPEGLSLS